jgi:predicted metalloprotease
LGWKSAKRLVRSPSQDIVDTRSAGERRSRAVVRYDKSTADRGATYVNDRRGSGSLGRGVAVGGGGLGLIIAIIAALFGFDITGGGGTSFPIDTGPGFDQDAGSVGAGPGAQTVDPQADTVEYMQFLMFDIQDTWSEYFERSGQNYTETKLNIFTDAVSTGCGQASSAVGPFYCPAPNDMQVYIDLVFFEELASPRFGASGDFAQAYVIAHEIGHHIQAITGVSDSVTQAQQQDPENANEYSIRQELQADCFAGVWANSANQRLTEESGQPIIEAGDIEEGLTAAASVGDDRLQHEAGGGVNPETWTHGSSEQRVRWFTKGFETGDPEQCDTFAATEL